MALFPTDNIRPDEEAMRRRTVMQEAGTRKLVTGFIALAVLWFIGSKLWDAYLLRQKWPPVPSDAAGLTVVSTLDRRGSYDTNLFQVVQSEGEARAELTDFGWDSIFSGKHGPLSSRQTGSAIKSAVSLDGETGFAMLAPFLAAQIRTEMGDPHAYDSLSESLKISTTVPTTEAEKPYKHTVRRQKTLGELIDYFGQEGGGGEGKGDSPSEGQSSSSQHVEHGLVIPGEILIQACPVVLGANHFSRGRVEEHPATVLGGKTYSVWLDLTPEGRSRFYQWSHGHVHENLLLILNGSIVANGRIAMTMDVTTWEITNLKDAVAAQKLVDYINSHSGQK